MTTTPTSATRPVRLLRPYRAPGRRRRTVHPLRPAPVPRLPGVSMTARLLRATAPLWLTAVSVADRALGWALARADRVPCAFANTTDEED